MFDILEELKKEKIKKDQNNNQAQKEIPPNNIIDLGQFLKKCCHEINASEREVQERLLKKQDIKDILSGHINVRTVKAHIKVWVIDGKKNFNEK